MNRVFTFIIISLFILVSQDIHGQSDKQKAYEIATKAIQLMDSGELDQSIELLEKAKKLDPDNYIYPYEIALAYYLKKDYKTSIKILNKLKKHPDANERLYQLLGNAYDLIGKEKNAFKTYDEGLEKFPGSGMILLEKGNVYWNKEEYNKALQFYEEGIRLDPSFSSNYYRAALFYCSSSEKIWGLIYGEIFMNLERNSKRTTEISQLLYKTYKEGINIKSKSDIEVSFCRSMTLNMNSFLSDDSTNQEIKLPYCMIYEPTLALSIVSVKKINLETLNEIRQNFNQNYYSMEHYEDYPNVLFDYQKKIIEAGHFEAYNYWLLMKGDEDTFGRWIKKKANKEKYDDFVQWYLANNLELNSDYHFYRGQY